MRKVMPDLDCTLETLIPSLIYAHPSLHMYDKLLYAGSYGNELARA